jgi:hypothetical protein
LYEHGRSAGCRSARNGKNWLASLAVVITEIADYEVRRGLLRAGKEKRVARLDAAKGMLVGYAPIRTPDVDMIPAGDETVIATTNVRHLVRFASARIWREIG